MTEPSPRRFVVERARWMDRLRVRQWIAVVMSGFLVPLVAMGIVCGVSYTGLSNSRDTLLSTVDPAQTAALNLNNALLNQETGVRGYALAANETFLVPYTDGLTAARGAEARLDALVGADPRGPLRQQMRADLDAVRAAADTWRTSYAEPVIAQVRQGGAAAVSTARIDEGKRLFDAVRVPLQKQQTDLAEQHDAASRGLSEQTATFEDLCIAGGLVLLALAAAVAVALRRAVTRPAVQLSDDVARIAAGSFEHPIVIQGPVEIRMLAEGVDLMRRRIVTELHQTTQAREQLDSQAVELRRSNAELEQFAYVASHDLQEPLRKVASFCQLLQRRYGDQLDERGHQYIEFAVDGAKRMQGLISDLLTFSRVGRTSEGFEPVDTAAVVGVVLDMLSSVVEDSGAEVVTEGLPTVWGDPALLRQLFQNLLSNAVKFRGEEPPRVAISARPRPEEETEEGRPLWEFHVEDNGIGIESQYADRIFVIFQRLHTREAYSGTGIGLALCRKIVEYHGGRIWLDTDRPSDVPGAAFRFTLPGMRETAAVPDGDPPGTLPADRPDA